MRANELPSPRVTLRLPPLLPGQGTTRAALKSDATRSASVSNHRQPSGVTRRRPIRLAGRSAPIGWAMSGRMRRRRSPSYLIRSGFGTFTAAAATCQPAQSSCGKLSGGGTAESSAAEPLLAGGAEPLRAVRAPGLL